MWTNKASNSVGLTWRNNGAFTIIHFRTGPVGVFGGQSIIGTDFSTSTSVLPHQYHSTNGQ